MKKLCFLLLILFSPNLLISQESQTSYNLQIIVNNFEKINGELRVCLSDKKEEFLKHCKYGKVVTVTNNIVTLEIENIEAGTYAVSLFHDENNNGVLDTKGLFEMPSEPYGFSNNPSILFGPPSFEKCKLSLNIDKQISIKLN